MTRALKPHFLALITAAALTLGGCSNGSADDKTTDADTPHSTDRADSDASGSDEPSRRDQEIAEGALLTLRDFPAGWEAATPEDDEDSRAGQEKIAECVGVEYDELYDDTNAEAISPDFTNEMDEELSVEVSVGDEDKAKRAFEIAAQPEFRECLAKGMNDEIQANADEDGASGVEVGDATLNELSFPSLGDESLAFRMTIPITASGMDFEAVIDFVGVRVGRGQTQLTSFGVGTQLPTEEFVRYSKLAVKRLESELARA